DHTNALATIEPAFGLSEDPLVESFPELIDPRQGTQELRAPLDDAAGCDDRLRSLPSFLVPGTDLLGLFDHRNSGRYGTSCFRIEEIHLSRGGKDGAGSFCGAGAIGGRSIPRHRNEHHSRLLRGEWKTVDSRSFESRRIGIKIFAVH